MFPDINLDKIINMKEMWNKRYAQNDYVYGKEPNQFFKQELLKLMPGKILLPAEGEGRNAVYAAKMGWDVYAFDNSSEAKKKAEKLASENKVKINYELSSFEEVNYPTNCFDAIGLFYAHSPSRKENHKKLLSYLKQNGTFILEGFSKKQINNNSGGPRNLGILFSEEELKSDFKELAELRIWEEDTELIEGIGHSGKASIIRVIGEK